MSATPRIVAVGVVDARGIAGTGGLGATWEELEVPAPGDARSFRAVFGSRDATFRRLDRQTRALVLAACASGVEALLSPAEREETALVVETSRGSLEVDLRYTRSLARGVVEGAIFPYTLQSTCLGDVALRLGLRGPTLSLSVGPGEPGAALAEARRLFAAGVVRHAVVGVADALTESLPGAATALRSVVALAEAVRPGEAPLLPALAPWPEGEPDPFAVLADACHSGRPAPGATVD